MGSHNITEILLCYIAVKKHDPVIILIVTYANFSIDFITPMFLSLQQLLRYNQKYYPL